MKSRFIYFLLTILFVLTGCRETEEKFKPAVTIIGSIEGGHSFSRITLNDEELRGYGIITFKGISDSSVFFAFNFLTDDGRRSVRFFFEEPMTINGRPYNIWFEQQDKVDLIIENKIYENTDISVIGQLKEKYYATREPYRPIFEGHIKISANIPDKEFIIIIENIYG